MAEVSKRLMGFGETRTRACRLRKDVGADMSSDVSQLQMARIRCRRGANYCDLYIMSYVAIWMRLMTLPINGNVYEGACGRTRCSKSLGLPRDDPSSAKVLTNFGKASISTR